LSESPTKTSLFPLSPSNMSVGFNLTWHEHNWHITHQA
jgi:hypothetical protein